MVPNLASLLLPLVLLPALAAQTFVRVRDGVVEPRGPGAPIAALNAVTAQPCGTLLTARYGQPIANAAGSSLQTLAFMNPACVNRRGQIAFVANAAGQRNQGVFVADGSTVRAIAMGCGQGGGSGQHGTCGDPSPLGGTFAGFFGGTVFAPPIDDDGDVLFLADLVNGTRSRGLFLYLAASQTIVAVAAVGDPSPRGGVITALGPGALGTDRQVVFLAQSTGSPQYVADLLQWRNGALTSFLGTGDPAPGGATVTMLGTESFGFVDGTTVFAGPVPSINACGQIAFRIITGSGRGIAVRDGGSTSWYLTSGMATPNGGTFADFQAAALNGTGEIAVFADYQRTGQPTSGWFVGRPGSFRNALSFYDPVDGGQCMGLAFSRCPMTPLSDAGDLVLWCDLSSAGNQGRIVVCAADGSTTAIARQGGPTGAGGNYGSIDAWPSMTSNGRVVVGCGTPGAGWSNAYLTTVLCGPAVASSPCTSVGGTVFVDDFGPAGGSFVLFGSLSTQSLSFPPYGELLVGGAAPVVTLLGA
ncbi:MAG: hypothetical protein FJ265_22240, partial [Planctomycetes bacterium]|nr:hypothetical protein [Planctomycetota bacterium]